MGTIGSARKPGRPSTYTPKMAERICDLIATTPRGLDFICGEHHDLPSASTVHRWLGEHEDFRESYLRARERQGELLMYQSLEIADTPVMGVETVKKADGSVEERRGDMLGHRTLQVKARQRMAGKLDPKKWGDATTVRHADPDGNKLEPGIVNVTITGAASG